ncbi:preprotein translocase subunit SecG [Marinilongibacter aquaticus]|uniref:preprotein translocase subunit SecG n=1 Tax=Marinilongibacter aquaticus TaxID=2975157 RepID=UPI0021BD753E|nr:preprotein translocase subunit SecG [Marinilongibacter aquaticus]UBM59837.1 preprotein translocase subunit SecG [Marinilongibacter aquaticus]
MFTTLLILMIIAAILLIVVILIQNPKDGGLSSEFGGSSTSQMFGVQKTGDILEQLTWGFFAFIVVGALATGIFMRVGEGGVQNSALDVETQQTSPTAPALNIPATPEPAGDTPAESTPAE